MCVHTPRCPPPSAKDRTAAHTIALHAEQGWSLLCNGLVVFTDGGELLPPGTVLEKDLPAQPASPGPRQSATSAAPAAGPRSPALAAGSVR